MFVAHLSRAHPIFFLVAFGKIRGGTEACLVGYLRDASVCGAQQLAGSLQARLAQQFYGRHACERLCLSVELHTAHAYLLANTLDIEI